MKTGELREQITFLRDTRTQRDDGGFEIASATLGTARAAVRPVAADEREQAGRLYGSTTFLVTMHALDKPASLTTGDSVQWDTAPGSAVVWQLRAIRQQPARPLFLELVCEAGAVL